MRMRTEVRWLPLFVDPTKLRVVIVGGGRVATRKLAKLPAGCRWRVIAPEVTAQMRERIARDGAQWEARAFVPSDLQAGELVIGAVDDVQVQHEIAATAAQVGAWYNDASAVAQGDVLLPACGSWGALTWALSTGGASPRLTKLIREEWEREYGMLGDVAADLGDLRARLKEILPTQAEREAFWRTYLPEDTLARVRRGQWEQIKEEIGDAISRLGAES